MQKRLCGREQEFGMRIVPTQKFPKGPRAYLPNGASEGSSAEFEKWRNEFARAIIDKVKELQAVAFWCPDLPSFSGGRLWLANGAVIYIDLCCILEAATAECLAGSLDVVLQEKALEQILNEAAKAVAADKKINLLALYKNNVGPVGLEENADVINEGTYASHHNYSYSADKKAQVFNLFRNFVPISLPLTGNGHVRGNFSGKKAYVISQRAFHIKGIESHNTTGDRGIINIRDESLMDKSSELKRFHLISRDATRCEFQTWLVDAMSHLVLRLAEEGWELPPELFLYDSVHQLYDINSSLEGIADCKLRCGTSFSVCGDVSLMDYNYLFLNAAKQLNPLSPDEKKCLEEWERVLELLKAKAFEKLVGELDWVTKWHLLKNKMKKYGFGLDDARAWKIDMNYHDISDSPKQSWFALLEEGGYIRHLVSKSDIKKAITTPPETRAKSRGEFIQKCRENPRLAKRVGILDWGKVTIYKTLTDKILGKSDLADYFFGEKENPFSSSSSTLEELYKETGL